MGIDMASSSKGEVISQLYEHLLELHEQGKRPVIIIDEANMLRKREIMEEFRGLLNLEVPGSKLLTFILIGLPEIDEWMAQDSPLRQRIAVRFTSGCSISFLKSRRPEP